MRDGQGRAVLHLWVLQQGVGDDQRGGKLVAGCVMRKEKKAGGRDLRPMSEARRWIVD